MPKVRTTLTGTAVIRLSPYCSQLWQKQCRRSERHWLELLWYVCHPIVPNFDRNNAEGQNDTDWNCCDTFVTLLLPTLTETMPKVRTTLTGTPVIRLSPYCSQLWQKQCRRSERHWLELLWYVCHPIVPNFDRNNAEGQNDTDWNCCDTFVTLLLPTLTETMPKVRTTLTGTAVIRLSPYCCQLWQKQCRRSERHWLELLWYVCHPVVANFDRNNAEGQNDTDWNCCDTFVTLLFPTLTETMPKVRTTLTGTAVIRLSPYCCQLWQKQCRRSERHWLELLWYVCHPVVANFDRNNAEGQNDTDWNCCDTFVTLLLPTLTETMPKVRTTLTGTPVIRLSPCCCQLWQKQCRRSERHWLELLWYVCHPIVANFDRNNAHGQLGDGGRGESTVPKAVEMDQAVTHIACGPNHNLAITGTPVTMPSFCLSVLVGWLVSACMVVCLSGIFFFMLFRRSVFSLFCMLSFPPFFLPFFPPFFSVALI